ncbi:DUF974-domain-containing protein [Cristinia sonorae]|uniref:DUF974-domain-containing protein n=1 Tax=Cristinia sonorae TaxID=1940300 RepID=A0A8K0XS13_9AGAR|nr:DUF974-domain-containing protein [Cristinia sonorae]
MAASDAQSHLVSLKVMRISRPALTTAWEPFYSSSPSFSSHSTASIMSLQTKSPLPGNPNTLRDLTHVTEVLMLPAAFGAIQLGETFSGCIAVNNDSKAWDVEGVHLRVEMQTSTAKVVLAESGGPTYRLAAADTMEDVVHYEIKELGQHVLACTVSYSVPDHVRRERPHSEPVTNPLSVKTKVHTSRSPSALLSPREREKVFLELHVQNLTQESMWLSKVHFECTDSWVSEDINGDQDGVSLFSGPVALIQPQDLRQYIYVLTPKSIPKFPHTLVPGSSIPLGRLHLEWRSSFGEPGRLSTSMLSRKIPPVEALIQQPPIAAPPPKQASAVPPYLQRSNTVGSGPQRAQSPQQSSVTPPVSAGSTPAPYRPDSPYRHRAATAGSQHSVVNRVQSPAPPSPFTATRRPGEDVEVDLIVKSIPRDTIRIDNPFKIGFTITVSAPIPPPPSGQRRKQRQLLLVIQHVEPPCPGPSTITTQVQPVAPGSWSPRLPSSGFSTPSPYGTPFRGDFQDSLAQKLLTASPRRSHADTGGDGGDTDSDDGGDETPAVRSNGGSAITSLPAPFSTADSGEKKQDVVHLGSSAVILPPIRLVAPKEPGAPGDGDAATSGHDRGSSVSTITTQSEADSELEVLVGGGRAVQVVASQDFELQYLPVRTGFVAVGGLRALLIADQLLDADDVDTTRLQNSGQEKVRTLRNWDVVAELWVPS